MTLQKQFPTLFNQPNSGGESNSGGEWLTEQEPFLAPNTVNAYGYALVDYFQFCAIRGINPPHAKRDDIVTYIRDFSTRSKSATLAIPVRRPGYVRSTTHEGFAKNTVRLRVATVRLYYQYLMEVGVRPTNPVRLGKHTKGKWPGGKRRGMVPRHGKNPWLPDEQQWQALLLAASSESIRNRFMLALAYDAGLRRGELCALESGDVQPYPPLIKLREETTKNQVAREVPYSPATGELYAAYLTHREQFGQPLGPLFLSESRRNKGLPITFWTWTKIIKALGKRAGLPLLTTHTLRHLRLTDLAEANWKLPQLAAFAGHSDPAVTMLYVHLSGRQLRERFRQTFDSMLDWRQETIKASLLKK